jgi:hypothetical protein
MQPTTHIDFPQSHLSWLPQWVLNLTTAGVTGYLNPSPVLAKGHMKCPHQGIQTTRPQPPKGAANASALAPQLVAPPLLLFQHVLPYPGPGYGARAIPYPIDAASNASDPSENADQCPMANIIEDDASAAKSNIFCFGAFADKQKAHYAMTLPGHSLSCHLQVMCVFSLCTTMRQMPSWPRPLQTCRATPSSKDIENDLNFWKVKDTRSD